MKMSKFVSTLAVAATAVATLTPAATAHAAGGNAKVNNDGSVTEGTSTDGSDYTGNLNDGFIAIANNTKDGSTGTAYANSDAHVTILDGYLALAAVPDFGFGTTVAGQDQKLVDNSTSIPDDGNDKGLLKILEGRPSNDETTTKATSYGFTLTADMGSFNDGTGKAASEGKWKLFIPGAALVDGSENATGLSTQDASLVDGSTDNTIVSTDNSKKTVYQTNFTSDKNTPTLTVPKDVQQGTYKASITWKLNSALPTKA